MSRERIASLCASALLAAACAPQGIVVADIDDVHEAGPDGPPGCSRNDDCDPDSYCERPCDAPSGTCVGRPAACGKIEDPKCGCSGTTYWNDCLRQHAGDSKRGDVECPTSVAHRCKGHPAGCPMSGSTCGFLVPFDGDPCAPPPPLSKCWILPSSCEGIAPSQRWAQCGNPTCVETCDAVHSEIPSYPTNMPCH